MQINRITFVERSLGFHSCAVKFFPSVNVAEKKMSAQLLAASKTKSALSLPIAMSYFLSEQSTTPTELDSTSSERKAEKTLAKM